ncbi:UDP-N-acetylmuramoyl-tripeptide--D-alanyl-D-alanine ligase [Brockia lithotrophica]|uniref:UDP-N-acetylmuramoyl-tripeptide--D-alanyl-D-alanine ligase n=1 Tax=Brockia lithotrophica TaxID=933949 RepID=A0A660L983_9BACL|nr:UDP-N-acetylmuramoyl-tripeptide--D-alanyl-D-alanine ligase [Brockia lithotrophica]RKQ88483.1 UDP-N-acetylmuramoyl-tripeptide--D-alanyl-D-alanine ligase [Brockia lithotrophica]
MPEWPLAFFLTATRAEYAGDLAPGAVRVRGVVHDSRAVRGGELFVPLPGARTDGHAYVADAFARGAAASFWRRSVPVPAELRRRPLLFVDDPLVALWEASRAHRARLRGRVVAVTGSVGKTTTKDLIARALAARLTVAYARESYNNHIGVPLTLLAADEDIDAVVLEMGMNRRGEIAELSRLARPDVAVITLVGESHIGLLGSREAIAVAKAEIALGMDEGGRIYIPDDDPLLPKAAYLFAFPGEVRTVGPRGKDPGGLLEDRGLDGFRMWAEVNGGRAELDVPLPGAFAWRNALYALFVARDFGIPPAEVEAAWRELERSPMRLAPRHTPRGALVLDDTYNAAPTSIRAAVSVLARVPARERVAVLGEVGELGEHAPRLYAELGETLPVEGIVYLLFGPGLAPLEAALRARGARVWRTEDPEALLAEVRSYDRPDAVLLFKASRYMRFERFVQALLAEGSGEGGPTGG